MRVGFPPSDRRQHEAVACGNASEGCSWPKADFRSILAEGSNRCKADTHNPQISITKWVDIRPEARRPAKPVHQFRRRAQALGSATAPSQTHTQGMQFFAAMEKSAIKTGKAQSLAPTHMARPCTRPSAFPAMTISGCSLLSALSATACQTSPTR